jgi:thymidine kinase
MYSGKSTELYKRVKRLQTIDQTYIIYNSHFDQRYGSDGIYTHDNIHLQCQVSEYLLPKLNTDEFMRANEVFIEEAQFFKDLYEFVKLAVETFHKNVTVIGLDGDSSRQHFGQIHQLLPLCDKVTKLRALCSVCADGTPGIFSKKIAVEDKEQGKEQIDVGSADKYIAVCRRCYVQS